MLRNANTFKVTEKGFGLIELLVSISIVVLVTSIIMTRHTSYNGAVLLRSEAYDIALGAREVQLAAVSAVGTVGDYRNVFGLHFDTTAGNNGFYRIFRDSDGDFYYDAVLPSEAVGARSNLDPRFEIDEIRLIDGGVPATPSTVSVVFERPNFDARFYTASGVAAPSSVSAVQLVVRLRGTTGTGVGEIRLVEITKTGQITVQ